MSVSAHGRAMGVVHMWLVVCTRVLHSRVCVCVSVGVQRGVCTRGCVCTGVCKVGCMSVCAHGCLWVPVGVQRGVGVRW